VTQEKGCFVDFSVFAARMGTLEVNIFSIERGIRAHAHILVMSKILSFYSGFVIHVDHVITGLKLPHV